MRILPVYCLLAALLVTSSCKQEQDDHLPPSVMKKVMLDINLAEAYSLQVKDSLHKGGVKNADSLAIFYKEVLDHYHITPEQFTASVDWYTLHSEEMDSLMGVMLPVVSQWQLNGGKK